MDSRYLSLRTFRKSGQGVATPMWFAEDAEGRIYMQTWAGSAKVRRIVLNDRVELAPSDARGRVLGPSRAGSCQLHQSTSDQGRKADRLLAQRYGWQRRLAHLLLWIMRRSQRVYMEVELSR